MGQKEDAEEGLNQIAELWLNYFENLYKEKWWKATKLLLKKAGLNKLDKRSAYYAGIIWIDLYDLMGAVGSKALKNSNLVEGFMSAVAERYEVDVEELWKIFKICLVSYCLTAFIWISISY